MENLTFLTWILILSIWTIPVHSTYYSDSVPYEPVPLKKTNLHFYLHDTLSGSKPTAVPIARPDTTKGQDDPSLFGELLATDDPLTEGPEITSKIIGNARGMYLFASQDKNLTLVLYVDLGFTSGEFKGSSLGVLSRNPIMEEQREMAVVGGRGRFRMASGFIIVKTQYTDNAKDDAVLEYNVEVVHT